MLRVRRLTRKDTACLLPALSCRSVSAYGTNPAVQKKWTTKVTRGIFVGYVLNAGGGWTGDIDVLDAVELTIAQLHSEVTCRRISFKEIDVDKDAKGDFIFPVLS